METSRDRLFGYGSGEKIGCAVAVCMDGAISVADLAYLHVTRCSTKDSSRDLP